MDCVATCVDNNSGDTGVNPRCTAWQRLGEVLTLTVRDSKLSESREVDQLVAIKDIGLYGDKHVHSLSPRQVLLAGSDVYQDLRLKPMTLRENLLVDFSTKGLESSGLLRVGHEVVLWLTFQCEACGHLEHRHPGIVKSINGRRGILARVLRGGHISPRDEVQYMPSLIAPISSLWRERVAGVLYRVPAGKLVEFRQLAQLAGVPKTYCRVFPKILSQLPLAVACKAQSGSVAEIEQRWTGAELFDISMNTDGVAALNH